MGIDNADIRGPLLITIAGPRGSGKSILAGYLTDVFDDASMYDGEMFRDIGLPHEGVVIQTRVALPGQKLPETQPGWRAGVEAAIRTVNRRLEYYKMYTRTDGAIKTN